MSIHSHLCIIYIYIYQQLAKYKPNTRQDQAKYKPTTPSFSGAPRTNMGGGARVSASQYIYIYIYDGCSKSLFFFLPSRVLLRAHTRSFREPSASFRGPCFFTTRRRQASAEPSAEPSK